MLAARSLGRVASAVPLTSSSLTACAVRPARATATASTAVFSSLAVAVGQRPLRPSLLASSSPLLAAACARSFASITLTSTSAGEFDAAHTAFLESLQTLLEQERFEALNLDVSLSDGVLSVASPEAGTWVLNKHGPTRQLWLSSPISGPRKYNLHAQQPGDAPPQSVGEMWRGERDPTDSLKQRLIDEWSEAFGERIDPINDFQHTD